MKQFIVALTLLSVNFSMIAYADPVFKWTSPDGQIIYSSKPPNANAKPALLPPIVKADVKLTDKALENCTPHGGIDCDKGSDIDGSVICVDGFKEAITRFKLYCTKAKLIVDHINPVEPTSLGQKGLLKIQIRNTAQGAAKEVGVVFTSNNRKKLTMSGPTEITGLSAAEYTYEFDDAQKMSDAELLALTPPKERVAVSWK